MKKNPLHSIGPPPSLMTVSSRNTSERDKASEQDTQPQIEAANFRLNFPFELAASLIW